MDIMLRNNYKDWYSAITYYGIILIVFIHLIGFLNLRKWLIFSGIGTEAKKIENQYGYFGIVILNGIATILFVLIAIIYNYRANHYIFLYLTYGIIVLFVLRGLIGYIGIVLGKIGSATPIWEFIFSSMSIIIGISGILDFGEK